MIRLHRHSPIGLDLREKHVYAAQLVGDRAHRLAKLPVEIVRDGSDGGASFERLWEVLERRGFTGRRVVLAAPRSAVRSSVVSVPPGASTGVLDAIARSELARTHQMDPGSFELACWALPGTIGAVADAGGALACACPHDALLETLERFGVIGVSVEAVDLESQAVARACRALIGGSTGALRVVAELGWTQSLLMVMIDSTVLYERAIPECALASLRTDIERVLGVGEFEAERAIFARGRSGFADDSARCASRVRALMDDYMGSIAGELAMSIEYAARRHGVADAAEVLLIGPGANLPGVAEHLGASCEAPARVVRPGALVDGAENAGIADDPALVVALGLAGWNGRG